MTLAETIAALNQLLADGVAPDARVFSMKPVDKYDGGEMPFEVDGAYLDDGKVILSS